MVLSEWISHCPGGRQPATEGGFRKLLTKSAADILGHAIGAIHKDMSAETSRLRAVFSTIARYPVKVFATFLVAPILLVKLACTVKNPLRRAFAIAGLLLALFASYCCGTFLGSLTGAALIWSQLGPLMAIGFLIGTALSVFLSVVFSILTLNAVSFVFLKMNTQEILDYLREQANCATTLRKKVDKAALIGYCSYIHISVRSFFWGVARQPR
ncbi:MAG: hypothetical protein OXJ53_14845 [Gammaproteobacteria bacterium]|nr:hypothetical protein [Gammaproteobacteria bacterium]MDE0274131.1 hypothetical protein [Gammaproteobacteria bacterium]